MIIVNELLEEKIRVQKKIDEESKGDLKEYVKITHEIALEFKKRKNKNLKIKIPDHC